MSSKLFTNLRANFIMSSVLVVIEPHLQAYRPKSFLGSHFFIINFRFKPFEIISYFDGISDSSIFYYKL
jgi:hypothetical protein